MKRALAVAVLCSAAASAQLTDKVEIDSLEAQLRKNPDDRVARYRLLFFYYRAINGRIDDAGVVQLARWKHISWFVEDAPLSTPSASLIYYIARTGSTASEPEHEALRTLWKRIALEHAGDWAYQRQYIWFLSVEHRAEARELLSKMGTQEATATIGFLDALDYLGIDHPADEVNALAPAAERDNWKAAARETMEQSKDPLRLAGAAIALKVIPTQMRLPVILPRLAELIASLRSRAGPEALATADAEFERASRASSVTRIYSRSAAR